MGLPKAVAHDELHRNSATALRKHAAAVGIDRLPKSRPASSTSAKGNRIRDRRITDGVVVGGACEEPSSR